MEEARKSAKNAKEQTREKMMKLAAQAFAGVSGPSLGDMFKGWR